MRGRLVDPPRQGSETNKEFYVGYPRPAAVIAIPVDARTSDISACLLALAAQRADFPFGVLLLLNKCDADIAVTATAMRPALPFALQILPLNVHGGRIHASLARRLAMDSAAAWLEAHLSTDGIVLTTDPDSEPGPDWLAANHTALQGGVDCILGRLGLDLARERVLSATARRYRRQALLLENMAARIDGHFDPRPHDRFPNHRTSSGASLAVRLGAYRVVAGLPVSIEADAVRLFVEALERNDYKVRHAPDVMVKAGVPDVATNGAAFPLHADDVPLLEATAAIVRRATWRGRLRRLHGAGRMHDVKAWASALGLSDVVARDCLEAAHFGAAWAKVEARSPFLARETLRPAELKAEMAAARKVLAAIAAQEAMARQPVAAFGESFVARVGRMLAAAAPGGTRLRTA